MNPRCIMPGEVAEMGSIRLPDGVTADDVLSGRVHMGVWLDAFCDCGAKLVQVAPMEWGCPKDRWYSRLLHIGRGHARLALRQSIVQGPLGPSTKVTGGAPK